MVKRRTNRRRLVRKLKELRAEAWRRMHAPVGVQREWLASVLRGHYAYYGLPSNWHRLDTFYNEVRRLWYLVLNRRSRGGGSSWARFYALLERFPLPTPHITHPRPEVTCLHQSNFRTSRVRESRTLGPVRAKAEWLRYSTIAQQRWPAREFPSAFTADRRAVKAGLDDAGLRMRWIAERLAD